MSEALWTLEVEKIKTARGVLTTDTKDLISSPTGRAKVAGMRKLIKYFSELNFTRREVNINPSSKN